MLKRIGLDIRKLRDFGIGTYIQGLLRLAAEEKGYQFVALHKPDEDLSTVPDSVERYPESSGLYSLKEPFSLAAAARKLKLDLLHCPHYVTPLWSRTPVAATIHDLIHLRFPRYLPNLAARAYARFFLGRAARKSALVFADSEFAREDIAREFGIDPGRILVTWIPVDKAEFEFSSEESGRRLNEIEDLPAEYVLYTGNNKPHKNLETALRAFAGFRRRAGKQWHFCLAGGTFSDAGKGAEILRLVEELRLAEAVRFLGYLDREVLVAVMKRASMFIFPSMYEGFGLPPVEAQAAGVPVVSSNASSLPEVLGEGALFADPDDEAMFAHNMERIAGDGELRARLIKNGRANCGRFAFEDFSRRILEGYRRILG